MLNLFTSYLLKTKKNKEAGFTLLELIVVIIILGILAAIALPSFLNQANRARQSEAQSYIGALNAAQQRYITETGSFATTLEDLATGIPSTTQNYSYALVNPSATSVTITATPLNPNLRGYAGRVFTQRNAAGDMSSFSVLCPGLANEVPDVSTVTTPAQCPDVNQ